MTNDSIKSPVKSNPVVKALGIILIIVSVPILSLAGVGFYASFLGPIIYSGFISAAIGLVLLWFGMSLFTGKAIVAASKPLANYDTQDPDKINEADDITLGIIKVDSENENSRSFIGKSFLFKVIKVALAIALIGGLAAAAPFYFG